MAEEGASVNEAILNAAIAHEIRVRGYVLYLLRRIRNLLTQADAKVVAKVQAKLTRLGPDSWTVRRLQGLLGEIREMNTKAVAGVQTVIEAQARSVAAMEIEFQTGMINAASPIRFSFDRPAPDLVASVARSRPFQGKLMKDWFSDLDAYRMRRVRNAINLGVIDGSSVAEISRQVREDLLGTQQQAEATVRTAISHIVNNARQQLYQRNDDILKGWQFVATLDGRTTITCLSLDGKVFPIGEGPHPPRHPNCRSIAVPITKSWAELGFEDMGPEEITGQRPFVADRRKVANIPQAERDALIGQVPATTTYGAWLRRQTAEFQDEVLGATRGTLFRRGGLTVDRFTDDQGKVFSLDELRAREAEAFRRAGL